MNRRDFLKATGAGVSALALSGGDFFSQRAEAAGIKHPLPAGYLSTNGSLMVAANNPSQSCRLAGVNWYGFECNSQVAGGFNYKTLTSVAQTIASLGFNCIRLPFCLDNYFYPQTVYSNWVSADSSLSGLNQLAIMDKVIQAAGQNGLKVILDCHRADAGWSTQENGLWYINTYSESDWITGLKNIVGRYKDYPIQSSPTVIAVDLHNEPSSPPPDTSGQYWPEIDNNGSVYAKSYPYLLGSTWGFGDPNPNPGIPSYDTTTWDWAAAAERGGQAVQSVNPNLLIIIEGGRFDPEGTSSLYPYLSRNEGNHSSGYYWPGGNLLGVRHGGSYTLNGRGVYRASGGRRINLTYGNKLVFSVHDYGPDYATLPWCDSASASSSNACFNTWDSIWGYISQGWYDGNNNFHQYPILLGEFGTENGYQGWQSGMAIQPTNTPQNQFTDWPNSYNNIQGAWFTYLVQYIQSRGIHWCCWALNGTQSYAPGRDPSRAEFYGVLAPDWQNAASQPMLAKLQSIM